jgi:hypothetical protein
VRKNDLAATEIEAKRWLATQYSLEPWMTSPAFFAPKHGLLFLQFNNATTFHEVGFQDRSTSPVQCPTFEPKNSSGAESRRKCMILMLHSARQSWYGKRRCFLKWGKYATTNIFDMAKVR